MTMVQFLGLYNYWIVIFSDDDRFLHRHRAGKPVQNDHRSEHFSDVGVFALHHDGHGDRRNGADHQESGR